ncbi:hypothetical protein [Nocardia brasiliensis]|uniref:hypothetical protein n=1 Tax=Nocardia brasiliensis TaxID=37326 RepID=UPI00245582D6|nr:hypothetical protein [Nocardia brasiliensis]
MAESLRRFGSGARTVEQLLDQRVPRVGVWARAKRSVVVSVVSGISPTASLEAL